jgi:hypothetical protein
VPNISRAVSTKLLEEFNAGPLSQHTGQRISDREQRGNRLGEIAGEAKHAAILRRLRHRKVRLMTGKRASAGGQCRVEWTTGRVTSCGDGRVMKFECEVGLADTEQGAV